MNPSIAALICTCGIAGLFYLDRDKAVRTSKALWLPVIYFWIIGSRSVSEWLGVGISHGTNAQLEGSPLDAIVFGLLLLSAVGVLALRRKKTASLLAANWPILLYFIYCLTSVTWSSHPDVSLKRWIKAIDDLAMVLVVITDRQPLAALQRLLSRTGFMMLPTSLLFIKYFPFMGRGFTPAGEPMNTGVTTNKNTLGVVLLVISIGTLWRFVALLRTGKGTSGRRRHLVAQGVLLTFCVGLLEMAHSATAMGCFILGGGLILATNLRAIRKRPSRVHALCVTLFLLGVLTFFVSGKTDVANALGRSSTLSGRTDIWATLIPAVPNPIIGAGFEGFWISPAAAKVWGALSREGWWHPEVLVTEAHNGYIEAYLNLGWAGVVLIVFILISGYVRALRAIRIDPSVGALTLAYVIASAVYSITEAGFRSLDPMWMFLLLAVSGSTAITLGLFRLKTTPGLEPISSFPKLQTGADSGTPAGVEGALRGAAAREKAIPPKGDHLHEAKRRQFATLRSRR